MLAFSARDTTKDNSSDRGRLRRPAFCLRAGKRYDGNWSIRPRVIAASRLLRRRLADRSISRWPSRR
jgi:hypothetical protein